MIIGVTDEDPKLVDEFCEKRKPTYPVVVLPKGELEALLGVPHFPYSGVIDGDGLIAYSGDSPESTIKRLMKNAKPGSIWPKKAQKAASLIRSGKLAAAWAEVQATQAGGALDAREQAVLERFAAHIEQNAAEELAAAKKALSAGLVHRAFATLNSLASAKPALPTSEEAAKQLAELKALPELEAELKAGEAFDKADEKEEALDYHGAALGFRDCAKKNAGTKVAEVAARRAKNLVDKGLPGMEAACPRCQEAKKACEKHAKPVKL